MLDNPFEEPLERNVLLSLGKNGDYLLVEISYFSSPMGLSNILLYIKAKGYHPALAHPEWYVYIEKKDFQHLKNIGVKSQHNLFCKNYPYLLSITVFAISLTLSIFISLVVR